MRPLRIEMSAFGPYAATEVVDFRELGDKRFFLITGPTGAGKTSVLDAMTFALYGNTTGDERSGKDMRSLFAESGATTQITLDFSVGPETYRVWRKPEQSRPKLRGEGFTTEKADAALWRRTLAASDADEGEVVASGIRDVDARVRELLGFDCDQFRQVVVLPQGRFREVLSADVKTREEILRQLFRTGRFADITDFLKSKRAESRRAIENVLTRRAAIFERVGVETRDQLDELIANARAAQDAAEAVASSAATRAETARVALEAARATVAAIREAADARSALEVLVQREPEVATRRLELQAARQAMASQAAWEARERIRKDAESTVAQLAAAQQQLPALEQAHVYACEMEDQALAAQAEAHQIEQLRAVSARAARAVKDAERVDSLRADVISAEAALAEATDRETSAQAAAVEAQGVVDQVEAHWRAGQASVLAAALHAGQPCPVCGSLEHPAPAPSGRTVVDAELDAARASADRARAEAARASERQSACAEKLDAAHLRVSEEIARLGEGFDDRPLPDLRGEANAAAKELASREAAAGKAAADLERCRATRAKSASELDTVRSRAQMLAERVEQLAVEATAAQSRLGDALAAAQFADEQAMLAARRTPAEVDSLEGLIARYDSDRAAATERAARAEAAVSDASAPDLSALEIEHREATDAAGKVQRELGEAQRVTSQLQVDVDTIDRFEADSAELTARHEVIGRLADLAEGNNELKLSFQRYVLGTYLDEVLSQANHRLQRMSGGRYRLERSTLVAHRGRAAGLALAVYDEQAAESRPAGTLSGGEGFMASLALALGLAEAVQAHAGGVRLETIFIDEGFGTLDPEALEMAIATLLDLAGVAAEQGRLVGIISHVPELKERIDARLEIAPGERGSSTRFVV